MPGLLPLSIPGRIFPVGTEGVEGTGGCAAGGVTGTDGVGRVTPGRTLPLGPLYTGPDSPGRVGGGSNPPGYNCPFQ